MLMLGFCVLAPLGDAIAKLLGQSLPVSVLLVVRFAIQAALLIPIVILTGRPWRMRGRILGLAALRTGLHILGIGMMFTALLYLPLADAIAIAFVMPFIMLLLGKLVLQEEVGPRRLGACIVGFAGTLMVVQPSFAEVGWPALLPLGVAVIFALFMLVTRQMAKAIDPIGLQAVSGVMATAVLVPLLLVAEALSPRPLVPATLPNQTLWLLLAIGILGTGAHLLMTWSLRFAPSATVAPMQYLEIPFATVIGWLIFRDLPDGLAAFGICVTVAAGLYVILRERAIARVPLPETHA
ncbi:membrane protein [Cribrihabitans marinus]|nr:membrane protein [Cribrihabitans marinus]